jgi:hypothetical protein
VALRTAVTVLAALAGAPEARAQAPREGPGGPPRPEPELLAALDADVVVFDEQRPPALTALALGTRVAAPVERVRALLGDPAAYRRAIPAFVRADVLRTEPGARGAPARLLAWELEIPLWNLEGTLWMRPRPDGVELELVTGDLVPGRFLLTAREAGAGSVLWVEGRANVREANFATRRLAARHVLTEPAMTASAAYVLMRALAMEAERRGPGPHPRRRPASAKLAPPSGDLDGERLGGLVAGRFDPRYVVGAVRSRPDGRLHHVALAVPARRPPEALASRLVQAPRWRALPGWKRIDVRAPPAGRPGLLLWEVDSSLPFVDFDTTWEVTPRPRFRARAPSGDWSGAVMGWDLVPARAPGAAVAVFSLHPRIENVGYVPRRLVEAEPLLEHGLALGLAYVDAAALVQALEPVAAGP